MDNVQEKIDSLKNTIDRLLRSYTALKNENDIVKNQTNALRNALLEKNTRIQQLEQQIIVYKTTPVLFKDEATAEDKTDIKEKISDLIKEVDKCITLLTV